MTVWRLKRGLEKKFHLGHPWVFSNELAHSPKGLDPGALVELRGDDGRFLAVGYGNPASLISFRVLSRIAAESEIDVSFFLAAIGRASELRRRSGLSGSSHRLCFAEGDGLPGLVIDRFLLAGPVPGQDVGQALVVQASTAGMDRLKPLVYEALERWVRADCARGQGPSWERTWLVASDDSGARRMEGLELLPKRIVHSPEGAAAGGLADIEILLQPAVSGRPAVRLRVDLIGGQKTGFFLDQRSNLQLAAQLAGQLADPLVRPGRPLRILDLCCYVGQWGAQLAAALKTSGGTSEGAPGGPPIEVTLVDSSAKALELAVANVRAQGAVAFAEKRDVLESLRELPERSFDVVVCDPPAFIKKKKDLPAGQAAYAKLNREAMRRLAPGGLFVTCSCSGLLLEEDFRESLARAASANEDLDLRFVARGAHGPDHPQLPSFPQGSYLKCWIGLSASTMGLAILFLCSALISCASRPPAAHRPAPSPAAGAVKGDEPAPASALPIVKLDAALLDGARPAFVSHSGAGAFANYVALALPTAPVVWLRLEAERVFGERLRTRGEAHVTAITPPEFHDGLARRLSVRDLEAIAARENLQEARLEPVCLGRAQANVEGRLESAYFVVLRSPDIVRYRRAVAAEYRARAPVGVLPETLPEPLADAFQPDRYFPHVTVGFTRRDLHEDDGAVKDVASCRARFPELDHPD